MDKIAVTLVRILEDTNIIDLETVINLKLIYLQSKSYKILSVKMVMTDKKYLATIEYQNFITLKDLQEEAEDLDDY